VVLRAALAAGLSVEQIAIVAGGQLERLLVGAEPRRQPEEGVGSRVSP
jgi:hypothetical protein